MRIEHVAIWVEDLEKMKDFYVKFFGGKPNGKYINSSKGFSSYFISFEDGARIEIMNAADLEPVCGALKANFYGYAHLAFSVGSKGTVNDLTERLRSEGYHVISEPRLTGDGYYESCVLDPEGNRVEITA